MDGGKMAETIPYGRIKAVSSKPDNSQLKTHLTPGPQGKHTYLTNSITRECIKHNEINDAVYMNSTCC